MMDVTGILLPLLDLRDRCPPEFKFEFQTLIARTIQLESGVTTMVQDYARIKQELETCKKKTK